jgi:hypothetical protein
MGNEKTGKIFNFADQLRIGDIGEADFVTVYKSLKPVKPERSRIVDFILKNGKTVELKTDSYDMERTPNMFMEHETVTSKRTILGGPWRSLDHKIDFFVYYYIKNKTFFWFKPKPLCETIENYIKENDVKSIAIRNKNRDDKGEFKSFGYKIPRACLEKILLREHKVK